MRSLAQKISTGKWLLGLILVAALFFTAGILIDGAWKPLAYIPGVGALTLAAIGLLLSYKQEVTLARSARKELATSLGNLADQLRAVNGFLDLGSSQQSFDTQGASAGKENVPRVLSSGTVYSPGVIAATPVKGKPHAHTAGRLAAVQDMDGDSSLQLMRIFNSTQEQQVRRLLWVGPTADLSANPEGWLIDQVPPGAALGRPHPGAAYLVLNLAGTASTSWEHITSSVHTQAFRSMYAYAKSAKQNGAVVILIREEVPSHFTSAVEELADVVMDSSLEPNVEAQYTSMPVFDLIRDVAGYDR